MLMVLTRRHRNSVVTLGKWIAKHKILICILGCLLIIPSYWELIKTRINLSVALSAGYLETVAGQDILVDEFGMGAFSLVVVEDMEMKDVQQAGQRHSAKWTCQRCLWYAAVADITPSVDMILKFKKSFLTECHDELVLFDNTTSSDDAMEALTKCVRLPISSVLSVV